MARGTWGGALDPNIFKVNILFLLGASKCQTGFKLRDYATQDNSAQDVADQVLSVVADGFRNLLKASDSLVGIDVLKIGTEEGGWAPVVGSAGGSSIADGSSNLPDFAAVAVTLKSEIRKRYGQGRMYLPLCADSDVDHNTLTALGLSRFGGFVDVLTNNFTGSGVTHDLLLVNAHPMLPAVGAPGQPNYRPEIPASWYDVVSIRINPLVTALRSRKAGVGS